MKILIAISAIVAILFFPIFYGKVPFPGSYMTAWYEPWRSSTMKLSSLGVVHKPVADDVFRQIYPFKNLASEMFRDGLWPLWNPYNGAGQPLLATMHPGFLNPFSFVTLLIPGIWGWSIYVIIQSILLGIGTYVYLRSIKISKRGSFYGAAVMLLSGFAVTRYIYGDYVFALGTLPILLFLIERWVETGDIVFLLGTPLTTAFLFVCVQPQISAYVIICTIAYAVVRVMREHKNKMVKIVMFLWSIMFGFALTAIQLLLTADLYKQSNMTTNASGFIMDRFLLPIVHVVTLAIPNYFGNIGTYNWWGSGDYVETIVSIGTIPLFFALYAGIKNFRVDFRVRFFTLVALCTLFLSLDSPITRYLYHLPIPLLSTAIPSRIFMLTTFSLVVASVLGFELIGKAKWKLPSLYTVLFSAALITLAIYSFVVVRNNEVCPIQVSNCRMVALRNTVLEIGVFFSFLILTSVLLKTAIRKIIPMVLICFIVVIGWYNSTKFIPFSSVATVYPKNSLIEQLRARAGLSRVLGLGSAELATDLATELRLFDAQYYEPLYNRRYGELIGYAKLIPGEELMLSRSDVEVDTAIVEGNLVHQKMQRLYDILGIGYFFYSKRDFERSDVYKDKVDWQDDSWIIRRNREALPRAYTVHSYEVMENEQAILERLFDNSFDPKFSAILEKKPFDAVGESATDDTVSIDVYTPNDITISTRTQESALLVVTDNYDAGWYAFIDGRETAIYRVNYTFRGIIVPSGEHVIRFTYLPSAFVLGKAISIASCLFWVVVASFVFLKRLRYRRLM